MIDLILLCIGTASLVHFLDMCMDEGMILHWYFKLISRIQNSAVFKVLGGCGYCFGTWLYIITFLIIHKNVLVGNFLSLAVFGVLGIGFNYVFIKLIEKV